MVIDAKPAGYGTFVELTWRSTLRAVSQAPVLFVGALVALAAIRFGVVMLDHAIVLQPSNTWGLTIAATWLTALLGMGLVSVVLAPVAIVVHRLVVVDDVAKRWGSSRARLYASWFLGFLVFAKVTNLPALLFGDNFALRGLMIGIVTTIVLRSALLFPAVAADAPSRSIKERVEDSWRLSTGHLRRLFGVWFLSTLPFLLLEVILLVVTSAAMRAGPVEVVLAPKPGQVIIFAIVGALGTLCLTALTAAATSWVYLWALDHPVVQAKP